MVTRLIAMRILADQSGNVGLVPSRGFVFSAEEFVEMSLVLFLAAHQFNVSRDVLRHVEAVLPSIGLGIVEVDFVRIKRAEPRVAKASSHKACRRVKVVFVRLRPLEIGFVHICFAHCLSHLGNGPVVVSVFQCFGNRFAFGFHRYKSVFHVAIESQVLPRGGMLHCLQGQLNVIIVNAFEIRVGDYGDSVIADHASCVASR